MRYLTILHRAFVNKLFDSFQNCTECAYNGLTTKTFLLTQFNLTSSSTYLTEASLINNNNKIFEILFE